MNIFIILLAAGGYLYLLFAVAFYIDSRNRRAGGIRLSEAWVYALSIAVYCTSWTFYGSVGRSAATGIGFLPIYIGPILVFLFCNRMLRKMVRIGKTQHITTIADFISARYGKSQWLAALATVIAVVGVMPYISLQLKAISSSFDLIRHYPALNAPSDVVKSTAYFYTDSAFYVAILMSLFVIIFGTRKVDATEQHRGMVTAVALESLVKLAAFLIVGVFVTWGIFDGLDDLFSRAAAIPSIVPLFDFGKQAMSIEFWSLTAMSMAVIFCLPRQFQVMVVENVDIDHLRKARWAFPLYLVAINLFVVPIALAGLVAFNGLNIHADSFVLVLPIAANNAAVALTAFLGGLSASTAMLIVETIALSTMVCNDLVMPFLIRSAGIGTDARTDLVSLVKGIRRASIVFILLLGYLYVHLAGEAYALVSIGLVSFAAVSQFAPAIVGGMYWKRATKAGTFAGLFAGFVVWIYTLLLPSLTRSGWLPEMFANEDTVGAAMLKPYALFGLSGLDPITHCLIWSMLANIGLYVLVSLTTQRSVIERMQAQAFVDAFETRQAALARAWQADIRIGHLLAMLERFVDHDRVQRAYAEFAAFHHIELDPAAKADVDLVNFSERVLAGAIGSSLARVVVASTIREKKMSLEGMMEMLSDASQAIEVSWEIMRETIDNIAQGVCVFDSHLRLVLWNRRMQELLDIPEKLTAVGTPLADFVRYNAEHGEYGPGNVDQLVTEQMALANRRMQYMVERKRPNGNFIEVFGKPLSSGGFVLTFTDITERKQVEEALLKAHDQLEARVAERTQELRRANEQLESEIAERKRAEQVLAQRSQDLARSNADLEQFAYVASHDLQEPLRMIASYLQLLEQRYKDKLDSDANDFIGYAVDGAKRMQTLINDLLAYSRIGTKAKPFEPTDCTLLLNAVMRLLRLSIEESGSRITFGSLPIINGDPTQLAQLFQNRIANAIKFRSNDRPLEVTIDAEEKDGFWLFSVRDNGIGISPEYFDRIFVLFQRLHGREAYPGTGIGLAVCKKIVEHHGGRIWVESEPGQGSTFRFTLPQAKQMEEEEDPPPLLQSAS